MNQNARKWVEALRSGEYEQGRTALRLENGFCCLGVVCDLYAKETGKGEWGSSSASGVHRFILDGEGVVGGLPDPVRRWLGLTNPYGGFGGDGLHSLADENDQGETFPRIADLIEQEPEGLFA